VRNDLVAACLAFSLLMVFHSKPIVGLQGEAFDMCERGSNQYAFGLCSQASA
jgi:hypothetical protein